MLNWFSNPRRQLLWSVGSLIVSMSVLVPLLTRVMGPLPGFLTCFLVYWLGFCLPITLYFTKRLRSCGAYALDVGSSRWIPWCVALQIVVIAISSFALLEDEVSVLAVVSALLFAAVNGVLEEFAWRGAFFEQGKGDPWFQAFGVGLFAAWHVPLVFAYRITYPGGPLALLGGTFAMGAFWAFLVARTNRIGWPIIGHVCNRRSNTRPR